jgi:hypothetical protein
LLGKVAFAGGALVAGGVLAAGLPRSGVSATSPALDRRILSFLLELELIQEAFYEGARANAKLKGELLEFAEVAGKDERAHVALLRKALKGRAGQAPRFDVAKATANATIFRKTAVALEELVVAAYVDQGGNLSPKVVTKAARIASVDARHAAWVRDLAGVHPAPRAADPGQSPAKIGRELKELGLVRKS